jgi:hypothetical protein
VSVTSPQFSVDFNSDFQTVINALNKLAYLDATTTAFINGIPPRFLTVIVWAEAAGATPAQLKALTYLYTTILAQIASLAAARVVALKG